MSTRWTSFLAVTFMLLILGLAQLVAGQRATNVDIDDATVVATVNSRAIPYSAIKVPDDTARRAFVREKARDPITESDFQEIARIQEELQVKRLRKLIRLTIRNQEMSRLGVEVTDSDIERRWERLRREGNLDTIPDAARAKFRALLEGLNAVYDGSENADDVYETRLVDVVSPEEWKAALWQYRSAEARAHLDKRLTKETYELDDLKEAVRSVVRMEKLDKAIETELTQSDPEFREYIRLAATDPRNEKVQSKGPLYRDAKRYEWWQQRYREADVEIKHERFKDVWKEPFE